MSGENLLKISKKRKNSATNLKELDASDNPTAKSSKKTKVAGNSTGLTATSNRRDGAGALGAGE